MSTLGRIEEFDGSKDSDWQQYVERMEYFFAANGITDATKTSDKHRDGQENIFRGPKKQPRNTKGAIRMQKI